jgi:hypothetical protein
LLIVSELRNLWAVRALIVTILLLALLMITTDWVTEGKPSPQRIALSHLPPDGAIQLLVV